MTRNLYLGADLTPVFTAGSPQALVAAVTTAFAGVRATNFSERAKALADEIAGADPHLVGLQEAVLWRSQTPAQPGSATHVEYDFLQILIDELALRGKHYAAVATATTGDHEAPSPHPAAFRTSASPTATYFWPAPTCPPRCFRSATPKRSSSRPA
ncbi:hypothetical protein ACFXA3_01825 [Streptomyces sp. NPDC059456]|uniref:hypothetical protein n=1 Tax=Streptomyces sp. NPDC059456 TaxID=3346838 RepID=UPI0036C1B23E